MSDHPAGISDTNAVILLDRLTSEQLPETLLITAVTLAELSAGPAATSDDLERARLRPDLGVEPGDLGRGVRDQGGDRVGHPWTGHGHGAALY